MNQDLEHLIVLQAQDLELTRLRAEVAEGPKRVRQAEQALAASEAALKACRDSLASEEKLRRGQESEIGSHRTKLERLRRSLDGATSAAQVSAFEHEITFAQSAITRLEDEEFASMERTEALEGELSAKQAAQEKAQSQLTAERERAERTRVEYGATIAGIERERTNLRAEVSEQWLATYDRLSKAKGTAVAEALGNATSGKCSACQMTVRPQRWQDLTGRDHQDEIFTCETCGRLLYWDLRRDTPKPWAAGERLQAARASGGGR